MVFGGGLKHSGLSGSFCNAVLTPKEILNAGYIWYSSYRQFTIVPLDSRILVMAFGAMVWPQPPTKILNIARMGF